MIPVLLVSQLKEEETQELVVCLKYVKEKQLHPSSGTCHLCPVFHSHWIDSLKLLVTLGLKTGNKVTKVGVLKQKQAF